MLLGGSFTASASFAASLFLAYITRREGVSEYKAWPKASMGALKSESDITFSSSDNRPSTGSRVSKTFTKQCQDEESHRQARLAIRTVSILGGHVLGSRVQLAFRLSLADCSQA